MTDLQLRTVALTDEENAEVDDLLRTLADVLWPTYRSTPPWSCCTAPGSQHRNCRCASAPS